MPEGQRNPGSLKGLERDEMSSLRLTKTVKEIVDIRLFERQCVGRAELHRKAEFVRNVWDRASSFTLTRCEQNAQVGV